MALRIPNGFANVFVPIRNGATSRTAGITFGVAATEPTLVANPPAFANEMQAAFATTVGQSIDSGCIIGPTRVTIGTGNPSEPIVGTATSLTSGGQAYESVPPQVAALVSKSTARGGRRGRGRFFLPWAVAKNQIDEAGNIAVQAVEQLQEGCGELLFELATLEAAMYLLHDDSSPSDVTPDVVLALTVATLSSTQRRRLGRS